MRNLCTIQTIKELTPIEGKDRIVLASFENTGWKVIVDKSFSVGDKVIYCEYDTLLPAGNPDFEFLRKRCYSPKYNAFRITCIKMGGVFSEGIVFPLSVFNSQTRKDGEDVTDIIGAKKYDPELQEERKVAKETKSPLIKLLCRIPFFKNIFYPKIEKGSWPSFFPPKTDETRVASIPWILEELMAREVYITEKLDGQSCSVGFYKNKIYVCSRNQWYKKPTNNNFWEIVNTYDLRKTLKKISKIWGPIVFQGEICGPGIQKNKYRFNSKKFFVFNIYSIKEKRYFDLPVMRHIIDDSSLEMVPTLGIHRFSWKTIDALTELSKGYSIFGDDNKEPVLREGIVIRPVISQKGKDNTGPVLGCKVINPEFLIAHNL